MGDFVNIVIPNYYYWEGDPPSLPDSDTKVSYKIIGPDSTSIKISSGFVIENTTKGYKLVGKRSSSKLTFTFAPSSTNTENGTTTILTNNSTKYIFKGNPVGTNKYEVNRGTVTIKESDQQLLMNKTKDGIDAIDSAKNTYVKNTVAQAEFLKTDAIYTSSSTMNKLTRLFYLFFNDFFTIMLIALFVIAILLVVKVDPESLYPTNLKEFPYVSKLYNQDMTVIKRDGGFCSNPVTLPENPHKVTPEDKPIVEIFNKQMNGDTVYTISSEFQENCKDTTNTSGAFSVLIYWILYLRLHNFVYIQKALNIIHSSLKMFEKLPVYLPFTILLVTFFFLVQNINNGVLQPYFKYNGGGYKDFDPNSFLDTNGKRGFMNIIIMNLISILSMVVLIVIPLFLILSVATIYANVSALLAMIISSSSVECMFLSFFSICNSSLVGIGR